MKELLNNLIKESMLNKTPARTEVLRSIKTAFTSFETAKNSPELTEAAEIAIINKLALQRKDSIVEFEKAGRTDLVEKETTELNILLEFLPKEATIEEIESKFNELKKTIEPVKKNMGVFIKTLKIELGFVDGKVLSEYVKNNLE